MIAVLTCKCAGANVRAYKFLQPLVENWMDVPVYQGRVDAQDYLKRFIDYPTGTKSLHELQNFITTKSRFIIIIGYNENDFVWSDISHGVPQDVADAELIVEQFA